MVNKIETVSALIGLIVDIAMLVLVIKIVGKADELLSLLGG